MIDDAELLAGLAFLEKYAHPEFTPALKMAQAACRNVRELRKQDETRKLPIAGLEMSFRTRIALKSLGMTTVNDLESFCLFGDEMVLERGKRHGFGKKCLKEARLLLKGLGLELPREGMGLR